MLSKTDTTKKNKKLLKKERERKREKTKRMAEKLKERQRQPNLHKSTNIFFCIIFLISALTSSCNYRADGLRICRVNETDITEERGTVKDATCDRYGKYEIYHTICPINRRIYPGWNIPDPAICVMKYNLFLTDTNLLLIHIFSSVIDNKPSCPLFTVKK